MPGFLPRALADWLAFHSTYGALKRLDPHLKADLGLTDADLRRLSRKAMHHKGPISIYRLAYEDFEEEQCKTTSELVVLPSAAKPSRMRGALSWR